jgi:hypothetical protein
VVLGHDGAEMGVVGAKLVHVAHHLLLLIRRTEILVTILVLLL